MKIGQLFDRVRSANLFVVFFAQPGKPLFKQRQHLLNKRLRLVVLDCHAVLLMGLKDRKLGQLNLLLLSSGNGRSTPAPPFSDRHDGRAQHQPKRLSCTAGSESVDHGEGFFRTLTPAGGSIR